MIESPAQSTALIYRIDAAGNLVFVNEAWTRFAKENDGESVMPDLVIGRRLLDWVADKTIHELYTLMIKRARAGVPTRFRYRCDSPDQRRLFEMKIHLRPAGEVEFISTLLETELREPVAFLDSRQSRNEDFLRVCSWCQKVAVSDTLWVPVEVAVKDLRLMEHEEFPGITHGICPPCEAQFWAQVGG